MLRFKKFEKEDINKVRPFMGGSSPLCMKAVGVEYMWSDVLKTEVAYYEGGAVIKETLFGAERFSLPRGERREEGVRLIEEYVRETGGDLCFHSVDDEELAYLFSRYPAVEIKSHRDYSDYLYNAADLAEYKGKKYHGQKNHFNKFTREYPNYEFTSFGEKELKEVFAFLKKHEALAPRSEGEMIEYRCCEKLLSAFSELDLLTGMIRVNGEIAAISVGEILGDTLIIHIEKALPNYNGIYPTICSLFARRYASDLKYINREDDSGDLGLRTSKTQYHPIALLEKRQAFCRFSRAFSLPAVFTERLVIDKFASSDMPFYAALATDDERNAYWGYDYKEDLGGEEATPAYFEKVLLQDEGRGVCYSFKIALLSGEAIGEAVVYNFRADGSAELGLRIAAAYKGKGYGREAFQAVAEETLKNLPALHARCFKANVQSEKMIRAAGFKSVREDEKMLYFRLSLEK